MCFILFDTISIIIFADSLVMVQTAISRNRYKSFLEITPSIRAVILAVHIISLDILPFFRNFSNEIIVPPPLLSMSCAADVFDLLLKLTT